MHLFKITCADHTGAAARITRALREAEINTRSMRFQTKVERYGLFSLRSRTVGEGEIVVKDEDWKLVLHQFEKLGDKTRSKNRKDLGLKVSKIYYQVTIQIEDTFGTLDDELQKLARSGINISWFVSGDPDVNRKVFVRIGLDCSPEKYHLAKRLLKRCLQEESPFLATAVQDL